AMAGGGSIITKDIPAFVMVNGNPAAAHGLNSIGLKRRGFSAEAVRTLGECYRLVYRKGLTLEQAISEIESRFSLDETRRFVDSLRASQRGITR
ncbi:MAG: acyl-[acyl-carrier-protein]--UDP-N-acetylglucosamine O-acyltransferase, partial [Pseudomonadota bacterium]|nr:acyl-[acyl-carrier-protein]--UDP-N-acetylglucosamine O-acyltransferase [Pseudomonadota bacterium]